MSKSFSENISDYDLGDMFIKKLESLSEYKDLHLDETEIISLIKILRQLIDLGLAPNDAIDFLVRENIDLSTLDIISEYYQIHHGIADDIENFKSSPQFLELAREFKHSIEIIYQTLKRIKPDLIIFPLRGSEPIKWGLEELNEDHENIGQFLSVPLGTTFDIENPQTLSLPEAGVSNVAYEDEFLEAQKIFNNPEIRDLLEKTIGEDLKKWNGKSIPAPSKLLKLIRKKHVLEMYLNDQLSEMKDNNFKIAIVDEVVSGGTMSHLILALKIFLMEKGLDKVKINVVAFQHDQFLHIPSRRSKSYHEGIKGHKFDWLEVDETIGNFFTIDRRSFLPAIFLLSEKLRKEDIDGDMVSLSSISNSSAEDFVKLMMGV